MIQSPERPPAERRAAEVAAELLARSAAVAVPRRPEPAAPPPPAAAPPAPPSDAALRLLQFEAEVRRVRELPALLVHLTNEVRALVPYGQAIVWQRHGRRANWRPLAVSGLATVDRHTPLLVALAGCVARIATPAEPTPLDLSQGAASDARMRELLANYPLRHALWIPLPDRDGATGAGVLFLRDTAFNPGATVLLQRLGETYAHAWYALQGRPRLARGGLRRRWVAAAALLLLGALGAMPVRLNVLAPVEVVAAQPMLLTSPINGVVKRIAVAPGSAVKAGDVLVAFEDIQPRNEMLLAQQRLAVAQARNARVTAAAFQDPDAAHDLATARAEYELARVNHEYALEVLARTTLRAPRDGVVIYSDRRDWEGRSVQVGEEILQVADPTQVALRVDLPTANGVALKPGDAAEVFLEHAPLGGVPAQVRYASYTPRTLPGGDTAYTVMLDPAPGAASGIGARGTARLFGPEVPLAVQLLRRPLSALRQALGL